MEHFPVSIYYAFKRSELMIVRHGFARVGDIHRSGNQSGSIHQGTWPMRTRMAVDMIGAGLTTSPRVSSSSVASPDLTHQAIWRREFLRELKSELPEALDEMMEGGRQEIRRKHRSICPRPPLVPAWAFSRYAAVLEANGEPMSVHTALALINPPSSLRTTSTPRPSSACTG